LVSGPDSLPWLAVILATALLGLGCVGLLRAARSRPW
jgi:hypothetical protein